MNRFCFYSKEDEGRTVVDNTFITDYMPLARADQIKVYLFGLMQTQQNAEDSYTIEQMAEILDLSESDIQKAIGYWQDQGLIEYYEGGTEATITYLNCKKKETPVKTSEPDELGEVIEKCQAMFKVPLASHQKSDIEHWYNDYGFTGETIAYVFNYSLERLEGRQVASSAKSNYIKKVAEDWHQNGIKTLKEAIDYVSANSVENQFLYKVLSMLGIRNRDIMENDRRLYKKWTTEMGLTGDDILRAAETCPKPNMNYLDGILKRPATKPKKTPKKTIDVSLYKKELEQI